MNKIYKIFGLVLGLTFVLIYVIFSVGKHSGSTEGIERKNDKKLISTQRESRNNKNHQPIAYNPENLADTIAVIKKFDIALGDLRSLNDEGWIEGLKKIAEDASLLAKRSDFESVTASALMIKRISDLAIGRLLAGEVAAQSTYDVLRAIKYQAPTDQKLIGMISQYYATPDSQDLTSESVMEFASRFEPDVIFPEDSQCVPGTTRYGMISEHNATLSLLTIAWAKSNLELSRVTALYLIRGGDRNLRGEDLAMQLELRVGKEIRQVKPPDYASSFGNMNPEPIDISQAIEEAMQEFERNIVTPK